MAPLSGHPRFFQSEAIASAVASSVATGVFFDHRPCLIDGQVTASQFRTIECIDGFVRIGSVGHLNKAKAFRSTRISVRNDADGFHGTKPRERLRDIAFCRLKRQIST
jgi:hypothetical protein